MLGETGIAQWRGDLMLLGRPLAGAEVAPVVEVHTVGDRIEAAPAAKFLHRREQFVLAMKAAGSVIAGIFRPVELAGDDDFEGDLLFSGKGGCIRQLGAGQAGRISDDGQHIAAQHLVCRPGEKCRVHATRVSDQGPSQAAEAVVEQGSFGGKIGFSWHWGYLTTLWRLDANLGAHRSADEQCDPERNLSIRSRMERWSRRT